MNITIDARHFQATDSLKSYIEKEVSRLLKYFDRIIDTQVIIEVRGSEKLATITVNVPNQRLVASEAAPKYEIAIESAVDKLVSQLLKYKQKMKSR
ncbi:ribosome-associated translation inhibitor RaiA [bacterium]|nr:ribosome-associated translation inhibitor RaiA [bacterium]